MDYKSVKLFGNESFVSKDYSKVKKVILELPFSQGCEPYCKGADKRCSLVNLESCESGSFQTQTSDYTFLNSMQQEDNFQLMSKRETEFQHLLGPVKSLL